MPKAQHSLLSRKMRHAQSMATMQVHNSVAIRKNYGNVSSEHAELAMRQHAAMQRLRQVNSELEDKLSEALSTVMEAEARAKHAELEAAHQRERMSKLAKDADEEIESLRAQLLALEEQQLAVAQNTVCDGIGGMHSSKPRKQRRASYTQRFDQYLELGGEAALDAKLESGDKIDTKKLLSAMRQLVKLSKDVVTLTTPADYDELGLCL